MFFQISVVVSFGYIPRIGITGSKVRYISNFFKRFYLFILREKGRGGKEGEKHQCVVASLVSPTGDPACNPGMCPDWELNR